MRSAKLGGILGRMQRIRKQQESSRQSRVFGKKHTGLPAAIGMATQKQAPGRKRINHLKGPAQTVTVLGGAPAEWRSMRPCLAKRKIAAQHQKTGRGKCFGHRHKQGGPAIGTGSVCQYQRASSAWVRHPRRRIAMRPVRSEEHTSELQSRGHLVCRLLLEKKK